MDSWLCLRKFYTGPNISRRPGRHGSRGATHDGVVKTHHIRRTENIAALSPIPGLLRVVHTDDLLLSVNWQILLSSALASLCLFAWREAGKDNSFVIRCFRPSTIILLRVFVHWSWKREVSTTCFSKTGHNHRRVVPILLILRVRMKTTSLLIQMPAVSNRSKMVNRNELYLCDKLWSVLSMKLLTRLLYRSSDC